MTLPQLIRKLRRDHGWTMEDLADEAGIGRSTLLRYEHGRGDPLLTPVRRIFQALGLTMSEAFAMIEPGQIEPEEFKLLDNAERYIWAGHTHMTKLERERLIAHIRVMRELDRELSGAS